MKRIENRRLKTQNKRRSKRITGEFMTKKKMLSERYKNVLQLIFVGSVTGVAAGTITTTFTLLAHMGESFSRGVYGYVRENPWCVFLLLLALVATAFLIGVTVRISSVVKGCGIPQAEGAARGVIRLRWWKDMIAMFSASLLSVFMGLSIGVEGPSALIGACTGDGVATLMRRNEMIKKYQITGGACTGLAVASNAPLTGIVFAFEEAHKRFTPEVFICAFSSVIFGMVMRTLIYTALGMEIQSVFHGYSFVRLPFSAYIYVVLSGVVCGFFGIFFQRICAYSRKIFGKIRLKTPQKSASARILIAVVLGGLLSFFTVGVMGGGHALIERLGERSGVEIGIGAVGVIWVLFTVLILKFFITAVNVGSGIPCGIFIPMLAIGACLGGVLNEIWMAIGMDESYCDFMIMICMAAFFVSIVRAPLTAVMMICEFTGSFTSLLPVIVAVSIGYTIGDLLRNNGIYEELLEAYEEENGIHAHRGKEVYVLTLSHGALAEKREVRDVLWPAFTRVTQIRRGEETILPDGATVLLSGDELTIVCQTDDPKKTKDELLHMLG